MGLIKKTSGCRHCDTPKVVNVSPDMSNYTVWTKLYIGHCVVMKIAFHKCTNYEGMKVLVYKGEPPKQIDPHFCDNHASPIARFVPTDDGWKMACKFAETME